MNSHIEHNCTCNDNPLIPQICEVIKITEETSDVKTFRVRTLDGKKPFTPRPGQLGMVSLVGVGEAMISVTKQGEDFLDFAIKSVGMLTNELHKIEVGQHLGIRGAYGNTFPMDYFKGKNLIIIGGGIGLAPVRSVILNVLENRAEFGKLDVVYGARTKADLVFKEDLFENWLGIENTNVHVTVDAKTDDWDGHVGFVPAYIEELNFDPTNTVAILCGPPIMIKFTMEALERVGFADEDVITTLEMRMKCGIGKCGRCNIGSKFVCLDGPVFSKAELADMPDEY